MSSELRETSENDPTFISRVITGDESWFYGYDPQTKQQSSQWKSPQSPRPKKARQVRSATKTMLIVFFDIKGIVPVSYTHLTALSCKENITSKQQQHWHWCLGSQPLKPNVVKKLHQYFELKKKIYKEIRGAIGKFPDCTWHRCWTWLCNLCLLYTSRCV